MNRDEFTQTLLENGITYKLRDDLKQPAVECSRTIAFFDPKTGHLSHWEAKDEDLIYMVDNNAQ